MKRWHLTFVVGIMSVSCAVMNVDAATITISIDGSSMDVPVEEGVKANGQPIYFINSEAAPVEFETTEGKIILGGALDPDPSITFGGLAFDFGTPSTFSFSMVLPLSPFKTNPSIVSDSFAGSVTNGPNPQVDGGVTVTALAPPAFIPEDGDGITEMQVFTLSDDGGVTWKNVGLDAGETEFVSLAANGSGNTTSYNQGPIPTISPAPLPFNAWTHMRVDINFQLSGFGDLFTFSGAKVLVPEPGTAMLGLMSLAALGLRRRRFV